MKVGDLVTIDEYFCMFIGKIGMITLIAEIEYCFAANVLIGNNVHVFRVDDLLPV